MRTGLEQIADLRRGAIAIVRQTFHDDGNLVRRVAFIDDGLVIDFFLADARALLDGALDGVLGDGRFLGLLDGDIQTRVEVGISPAQFGRDHDFADQFDDHLAFFVRARFAPGLFPLCAHKIFNSVENLSPVRKLNCFGAFFKILHSCGAADDSSPRRYRGKTIPPTKPRMGRKKCSYVDFLPPRPGLEHSLVG